MASAPGPRASARQTRTSHTAATDLAGDVAAHLARDGEYRAVLDSGSLQQLVDLRWAALRAGRALGRSVKVVTTQPVDTDSAPISVQVRFAAGHGPGIPLQRSSE
jgi:hypothetical protein